MWLCRSECAVLSGAMLRAVNAAALCYVDAMLCYAAMLRVQQGGTPCIRFGNAIPGLEHTQLPTAAHCRMPACLPTVCHTASLHTPPHAAGPLLSPVAATAVAAMLLCWRVYRLATLPGGGTAPNNPVMCAGTNAVDVTITQGSVTHSWKNYRFTQFSDWVSVFHGGTGTITVNEAGGSGQ